MAPRSCRAPCLLRALPRAVNRGVPIGPTDPQRRRTRPKVAPEVQQCASSRCSPSARCLGRVLLPTVAHQRGSRCAPGPKFRAAAVIKWRYLFALRGVPGPRGFAAEGRGRRERSGARVATEVAGSGAAVRLEARHSVRQTSRLDNADHGGARSPIAVAMPTSKRGKRKKTP